MTGCSTASRTAWFDPDDLYPTELVACAAEPTVPARPAPDLPRSEEDKANYVKDLHGAYADCKDDVAGMADRKARYRAQYDNAQRSPLAKALPWTKKKVD